MAESLYAAGGSARGDYATSVEFRSRTNGQDFTHRLRPSGKFHWVLRAGSYEITDLWSGFERVSHQGEGIRFQVPAGRAAYLGELYVQLPSVHAKGRVSLLDDFDNATNYLRYRYPSLKLEEAPEKRLFRTVKSEE